MTHTLKKTTDNLRLNRNLGRCFIHIAKLTVLLRMIS